MLRIAQGCVFYQSITDLRYAQIIIVHSYQQIVIDPAYTFLVLNIHRKIKVYPTNSKKIKIHVLYLDKSSVGMLLINKMPRLLLLLNNNIDVQRENGVFSSVYSVHLPLSQRSKEEIKKLYQMS